MSGNPAKFLQGHNAFGSDDLMGMYLESGILLRRNVGLFPSIDSWDACSFSVPQFSRIDITRSYRFGSDAEKQDYIRFVAGTARTRHGAARLFGSETAYFGQNSRRWSFKIYDKLAEYQKNNKGRDLDDELMDWLRGVARFELCLRGQELTGINDSLRLRFFNMRLQDVWQMYFDRIDFNENTAMKTIENYGSLTNTEIGVYLRWKNGEDLRHAMTKTTFYRLRQGIKKGLGVDISVPPAVAIADDKKALKTDLNASGWDPQPLEHRTYTPRQDVKDAYGFN
jgi:II/X family phage/plasmid replication protein